MHIQTDSAVTSRYLDEIMECEEAFERDELLERYSPALRWKVLEAWSRHDDLKVQDILTLRSPYKERLQEYVCGNPRKNLNGAGRTFVIGPDPNYEPPPSAGKVWGRALKAGPVLLQMDQRNGRRLYKPINKPVPLPAHLAITAMMNDGPSSIFRPRVGRLREYTGDEYILAVQRDAVEQAEQAQVKAEDDQAKLQKQFAKEAKRWGAQAKEMREALGDEAFFAIMGIEPPKADPPQHQGKKKGR